MPAKIARLAARPPFVLPKVTVADQTSPLSCRKATKAQYSRQIGSHLGNPGFRHFIPIRLLAACICWLE